MNSVHLSGKVTIDPIVKQGESHRGPWTKIFFVLYTETKVKGSTRKAYVPISKWNPSKEEKEIIKKDENITVSGYIETWGNRIDKDRGMGITAVDVTADDSIGVPEESSDSDNLDDILS
jgi:hypothetical protein